MSRLTNRGVARLHRNVTELAGSRAERIARGSRKRQLATGHACMNILLVLIPLTLLGLLVAVAMFFWAVNHQQFDDLDNPGAIPLLEDSDHGEPRADSASSDAINGSSRFQTLENSSRSKPYHAVSDHTPSTFQRWRNRPSCLKPRRSASRLDG